jgi:centrosomal protein CEP104
LGHVSLGDNVETGFKSRELKSVHVDVVARFIRVLAHKCHVNVHNT